MLSIMASKQEALRERIVNFYNRNVSSGEKFTVEHFKTENVPVSTIYRILASLRTVRKSGSGRPAKIMNKRRLNMLKFTFNDSDSISQRDAAKKYICSQSYVCRSLKKVGVVCRKKVRAPEYTEQQIKNIKSQCRWMTRNYAGKCFILDDESYFPLSKYHIPGNDRYYTTNNSTTPPDIKHKYKHKFEQKVMLYVAISERGISKLWFKPSGLAVNQNVYENECLKKILMPFIRKHHADGKYVSWPDKASSHYAKKTISFLQSNNIPFVPKTRNPTNLPQCRPIEDFFGYLSSLVYKNNWRAENCAELIKRIKTCVRKMDRNAVQRSCTTIMTRLRRTADHGPYSNVH